MTLALKPISFPVVAHPIVASALNRVMWAASHLDIVRETLASELEKIDPQCEAAHTIRRFRNELDYVQADLDRLCGNDFKAKGEL